MKFEKTKILIVVAEFNQDITYEMKAACLKAFAEHEIEPDVLHVPGALEIPYAIQNQMRKNTYDAVIALGCLIKGDTDHYGAICDMLGQGIMHIMMNAHIPIIFEVLMTDTHEKAEARIQKGYHAALSALRMANIKALQT